MNIGIIHRPEGTELLYQVQAESDYWLKPIKLQVRSIKQTKNIIMQSIKMQEKGTDENLVQ